MLFWIQVQVTYGLPLTLVHRVVVQAPKHIIPDRPAPLTIKTSQYPLLTAVDPWQVSWGRTLLAWVDSLSRPNPLVSAL
jgi:hypothetical protein